MNVLRENAYIGGGESFTSHAKRTCRYIQDGARSYKLHYILQNARLQGLYSCKNTCYCKINAMQD